MLFVDFELLLKVVPKTNFRKFYTTRNCRLRPFRRELAVCVNLRRRGPEKSYVGQIDSISMCVCVHCKSQIIVQKFARRVKC